MEARFRYKRDVPLKGLRGPWQYLTHALLRGRREKTEILMGEGKGEGNGKITIGGETQPRSSEASPQEGLTCRQLNQDTAWG